MERLLMAFMGIMLVFPSATSAQGTVLPLCLPEQWEEQEFFKGFSPGGSNDLPGAELTRLHSFIAEIPESQYLVFQGTFDSLDWDDVSKSDHRLDHEVGEARAYWARQQSDRGGVIVPPDSASDRGVHVYSYVCSNDEGVDSAFVARQLTRLSRQIDVRLNDMEHDTVHTFARNQTNSSSFGLEVNLAFLASRADSKDYWVPGVGLTIAHSGDPRSRGSRWEMTFAGGWRPVSVNEFGKRAQLILLTEVSYYPKQKLGMALGARGSWETIRGSDEFLERAYGLYIGPRLRLGWKFHMVLGADIQYSVANPFDGKPMWKFGFASSSFIGYTPR